MKLLFASRLNSMGARRDLWVGDHSTLDWIARQGTIKGLDLVDFNCPQHLQGLTVEEVKSSLKESSLKTGAVCTRFTEDFVNGAFTNPEHAKEGTIRKLYATSMGENAVHGSDSEINAQIESSFFFAGNEIF